MSDLAIVFYTANCLHEPFAGHIRSNLISATAAKFPLIVVSHKPMDFGDVRLVVQNPVRSHLQIYKNILQGALAAEGYKYIACCEDDVLYAPSHFTTSRPENKFSYDFNKWGINTWVNPPMFGYRSRAVINQLIAPRELLIEALDERFALYPDEASLRRKFGEGNPFKFWGDLGRYEKHLGVTVRPWEPFAAPDPSVVFSHDEAFGFLSAGTRKSVGNAPRTELPYWGSAQRMLDLWNNVPAPSFQHIRDREVAVA